MYGRVLTVAGSDSGGGAGIQADLKTITALGGFGMSAITALTAQNSLGIVAVEKVSADFVQQQIAAVWDDLGVDCVKTGMLGTSEIVMAVVEQLERSPKPLVVDPIILSSSGTKLLSDDAIKLLTTRLFPLACLITPNIPEAERLTGLKICNVDEMRMAASALLNMGSKAVLLKGGHLSGDVLTDLLLTAEGEKLWHSPRQQTRHTHGTGCTLASAVAAGLAQDLSLVQAVARARFYLQKALRQAPGYGSGSGPLNHSVTFLAKEK